MNIKLGKGAFQLATFVIALLLLACSKGGGKSSSASDEGTPSAPVTLTLGTAHSGSIGKGGTSYYRFTTATNSVHRISLTNTASDLWWTLFSDSSYNLPITECDTSFDAANEVCTSDSALTAGKTYYLSVDEGDLVAGKYNLLVAAVTTARAVRDALFEIDGTWQLCKFDSSAGHDIDDVLTITGTVAARSVVHASSTDASCSGIRTPVSTLTYAISETGTATVNNWTDGTILTAPPALTDGSAGGTSLTVTRLSVSSATGMQEAWVWYVDDSIPSKARLYQGSNTPATPCAASSEGYPQCLMSTEYYTRQ